MEYKVSYSYITDTDPEETLNDTVKAGSFERAIEAERVQVCRDILSLGDAIIKIEPNGGRILAYDSDWNMRYTVYGFSAATVFPSSPTLGIKDNEVARYGFFLGDLSDEVVEKISNALRSGEPFNTGWMSTVKEYDSAIIKGDGNGNIHIQVSTYVGDLEDRITWACDTEELSMEEFESAYNALFFDTCGDCVEDSADIVQTKETTLEAILDEISKLVDSNHAREQEDCEMIEASVKWIISQRGVTKNPTKNF